MIGLFLFIASIVSLDQGWRYAVVPHGAPRPSAWAEEITPRADQDRWYRVALPSSLPAKPVLVFRSYVPSFSLFVEDTRFYTFHAANEGLRLHAVPLPRDAAGKAMYVHIDAGTSAPLFGGAPFVVSSEDVPRALVRTVTDPLFADLDDILLGIALIVVGLAAVFVSRMRSGALLWFGVFAALYGLRLELHSYGVLLLGMSHRSRELAGMFITYIISIPGWMLARKLLGDGWKSTLRWQVGLFAIFAPIGIAADLLRREPGSMELVNNVLVVLGGVNILFNLFVSRAWKKRELTVVLIGAVIFMTFALVNNFASLGLIPLREFNETPGFLAFVAALAYATLRAFIRGERERVALEGELATAREIQRSILPTSMPVVPGFTFSARYDPASSVAGDFYDFLVVSPHEIGVIVADVAGHGVPAALIASMVKVAVSSLSHLAASPASLLSSLNEILRRDVRRNFVTATYLYFSGFSVSVANAGHPPPVLIRGQSFHPLGPPGVLLGRFAATYTSSSLPLQPGDRIAIWTDGVVEARNARGEAFGEERLHALLLSGATVDAIVEAVHGWRVRDDADDLTVILVEARR